MVRALRYALIFTVVTLCGCGPTTSLGPPSFTPGTTSAPAVTGTATASATATRIATPTLATATAPAATATTEPTTTEPTTTGLPSPSPVAPPLEAAEYCRVGDQLTPNRDYDATQRTYLDWTYTLPREYVASDLVNATTGGPYVTTRGVETLGAADVHARAGDPAYSSLLSDAKGAAIRQIAYTDLAALRASALAAGTQLVILSAYRSYAVQELTFDYWVGIGGYAQALRTSARPGHSEHQLGTVIDFGDGIAAPWEYADFAMTPAGAWLAVHAAEFGFVMSFPSGMSAWTCYDYEPWHYRWVGKDLAMQLRKLGVALRVYQAHAF